MGTKLQVEMVDHNHWINFVVGTSTRDQDGNVVPAYNGFGVPSSVEELLEFDYVEDNTDPFYNADAIVVRDVIKRVVAGTSVLAISRDTLYGIEVTLRAMAAAADARGEGFLSASEQQDLLNLIQVLTTRHSFFEMATKDQVRARAKSLKHRLSATMVESKFDVLEQRVNGAWSKKADHEDLLAVATVSLVQDKVERTFGYRPAARVHTGDKCLVAAIAAGRIDMTAVYFGGRVSRRSLKSA